MATAAVPAELAGNLCWLLSRSSQLLTGHLSGALHDLGFPARTHQVLAAAAGGEHTQIELARMVGLDKTTMVATIDQAERLGLAERRPSPTDRRVKVVVVTEAGRKKLAEADVILDRLRDETLDRLPEADREAFVRSLARLAEPPG